MSDPRDWVTTGVTPTVDADVARRAAVFVAGASLRLGWADGALATVLDELGLLRGVSDHAPGGGLFGCPSATARNRHIREGVNCLKCWPGGRQTLMPQGILA